MGVGGLRANLCHLGSANSCNSSSSSSNIHIQAAAAASSLKKIAAESRPWLVVGFFLNAFDHVPVIVNVNVIVGAYSLFTRALRSEFRALVAHFLWPCLAANCPIIHSISNKKCSLSQTLKPPTSSPSDESESWTADCGLFFISWHSTEVCSLTKKCRQTLLLK